jgi:lysophospholipase L1-like esterase
MRKTQGFVALAVTAALAITGLAVPAFGSSRHDVAKGASPAPPPVVAGGDYLALGDSVSFGFREPQTSPAPDYKDAASFVGYPEDVGAAMGLTVENLACPGETSGSLINPSAPNNGCENHPSYNGNGKSVPGGYRTAYPLHVAYTGSQLAAGVTYLKSHPQTTLVTLMIGANDYFVCQETTKDSCQSRTEVGTVLAQLAANVVTILKAVRGAGYTGQIVLVGYYSLDYANPLDNEFSTALDTTMTTAGQPFGVEYASGFAAWAAASKYSGGNPCHAGLLTQLYTKGKWNGTCGIHPTPAGAALLAQAVEETVTK